MKRRDFVISCAGLGVVFSVPGCGMIGGGRPKGFPRPYPCTVTVTKDGQPIVGAQVALFGPERSANVVIGGTTDERGMAKIFTAIGNYQEAGAPSGEYHVMIKKDVILEETLSDEELNKLSPDGKKKHAAELAEKRKSARETPEKTASPKSPVVLTVEKEPVTITVDLAEYF